jgi:Trk-type K+ transport system membrane component
LIIIGGIGFPVLIAILGFIKNKIDRSIDSYKAKRVKWHMVTNQIGVKIVLLSTFILLLVGTVGYYVLETDTSLKGTSGIQKFMTSFFGSVSARTAGFNVVDITEWSTPTILLMLFLMWVGASPGSTGGGIKTTTFTVALKTTYDFFRGRQNVEIGNREIGAETLKRVLVVIILSGIVISTGFFSLMINDPGKDPVYLLFESFSAFGTVGLSLVDTGTLSENSKITIIIIMFLGRLGPLTVLSGLFFSQANKYYKYPKHNFSIN